MTIIFNSNNAYTNADQKLYDGIISIILAPLVGIIIVEYLRGNLKVNFLGLFVFVYFILGILYNILKFSNMDYKTEKNQEVELHKFHNRLKLNNSLNKRVDKWGNYY